MRRLTWVPLLAVAALLTACPALDPGDPAFYGPGQVLDEDALPEPYRDEPVEDEDA